MFANHQNKSQYSENEAAKKLGLSVEQLRSLVRNQIVRDEDVPAENQIFHASDLVVLRILATQAAISG